MNDAQVAKGPRSDDVLGLHAFRACGYSPMARFLFDAVVFSVTVQILWRSRL